MTHDEAMQAAVEAVFGPVDNPQAWRHAAERAVTAYLAAFGVRDLAGLVEAARDAASVLLASDYNNDERISDAIHAALSPADETR